MRRAWLAALLLCAACSRRQALNYKHCLKLRVGMTRERMIELMGPPEATIPFEEGKSLEYLRGRTAYEWSNPATMPSGDHASVEDATGKVASVRCAGAEIMASVYDVPVAPANPPPAAAPRAPAAAPAKAAPASAGLGAAAQPLGAAAQPLDAAIAAYRRKDLEAALRLARPLGLTGDATAQLLVGQVFLNAGKVGLAGNPAEAMKWFYQAGLQKNCEAEALYLETMAEKASADAVERQSAAAAELDCPALQLFRARRLPDGAPAAAEGDSLLRRAADGGCAPARLELGLRLQRRGADPVGAYRLVAAASRRAVAGDFDEPLRDPACLWRADDRAAAEKALAELAAKMTRAQREAARRDLTSP